MITMQKLAKWWVMFRDEYEHFAFITNEIMHNRWPEPDVLLPPRQREVAGAKRSTKADLSSAALLEFLETQKKKSTVFDGYVAADKRREVMTDE
jgi:hypothetical protein